MPDSRRVLLAGESWVGTNTLLLSPATWESGEPTPNRLELLRSYVRAGGGLIIVGAHWCPPPIVEWPGYERLWQQLVGWAAGR